MGKVIRQGTENPVCPYCGFIDHNVLESADLNSRKHTGYLNCFMCKKRYRYEVKVRTESRTFKTPEYCDHKDAYFQNQKQICPECGKSEFKGDPLPFK